jgi:Mn-dependent DtxR family transcriptional regulator
MTEEINGQIIEVLKKTDHLLSTKDIGEAIGKSWHTVQEHCLRLQIAGKVNCLRVGRVNLWSLKK